MDEQGGGGRRVEMNETNRAPANGSLEMSLDEERIQPTKDPAITPADVLCGRDKTSFNHGESSKMWPLTRSRSSNQDRNSSCSIQPSRSGEQEISSNGDKFVRAIHESGN
jgi:hypothetical protein